MNTTISTKDKMLYAGITLGLSAITYFLKQKQHIDDEKKARNPQILSPIKKTISKYQIELNDKKNINSLQIELEQLKANSDGITKIDHLLFNDDNQQPPFILNPLLGDQKFRTVEGGGGLLSIDQFVYSGAYILGEASFNPYKPKIEDTIKWLKGGPRKNIFFNPEEVSAAIVTCGGLCPGLNDTIRAIVMTLFYNYGVKEIYGIQFGYKGFYQYDWINFTPENVKNIHHEGGTILGTSRGGFDQKQILDSLVKKNINQVYVIGGDGTHRGVQVLCKGIKERQLNIAICGLPKTIDNDITIIDKSFGFQTAVSEAIKAIESAYVESISAENGIGLVKVMGRSAGFIALQASIASRKVNICLIPEVSFDLYGEHGLLQYIANFVQQKKKCLIVVAEGASSAIKDSGSKKDKLEYDESNNIKLDDVGILLRDEINSFCKSAKVKVNLKYIDPSYTIRTIPANAHDKNLCGDLAQNAVHGLMAGFTQFCIGKVQNQIAYIPIEKIVGATRRVDPQSREYSRLIQTTRQPPFLNDN